VSMVVDTKQVYRVVGSGRRFLYLALGIVLGSAFWVVPPNDDYPTAHIVIGLTLMMAWYWMSECIPLAITSLLPLIVLPLGKVMSSSDVAENYLNDSIILFIGTYFFALAMQTWDLHKRIAMRLVLLARSSARGVILSFIVATGFLSMWLSNTATTTVMVPLAMSILDGEYINSNKETPEKICLEEAPCETSDGERTLKSDYESMLIEEEGIHEIEKGEFSLLTELDINTEADITTKEKSNYTKALLLSIAYSSTTGGFATLIGTGANLAFRSQFEILFPHADDISFFTWTLFALPLSIINLTVIWVLFAFIMYNKRKGKKGVQIDASVIKEKQASLGRMTLEQWEILILMIATIVILFLRQGIEGFKGWTVWFDDYVKDGTVAIFGGSLLFVLPSSKKDPSYLPSPYSPYLPLLSWKDTKNLPWNVVLLLGGGYALSSGFTASNLDKLVADYLTHLEDLSVFIIMPLLCIVVTVLTNFISNVATVNIVLPIVSVIAVTIGQHPLLLMIPCTLAASCAFVLPAATPPNAIVFGTGKLQVLDMVKPGLVYNTWGVISAIVWMIAVGLPIFGITLGKVPHWADE